MDLRQLKRFLAVVETQSFNKAAEMLAVSQPSLTRSIQMLEGQLQLQLLDRGPRGVVLTPAGKELYPYAKAIINERKRAMDVLQDIKSKQGFIFTIGSEPAYASRILPSAMWKTHKDFPEISITVKVGSSTELLEMLRQGEIEILIGSRGSHLDLTNIEFEQLDEEVTSAIIRADHPLMQQGGATYKDLQTAKWIAPDRPSAFEAWAQTWLQHKVIPPKPAIQTSSTNLIRECLLNGDYVHIGDYSTFADEIDSGRLVQIQFDVPVYKRPAGIFRRSNIRLSKPVVSLIQTLRAEKRFYKPRPSFQAPSA